MEYLIEDMVASARAALTKEMPRMVDLYLFGDTDMIEVSYKGVIRRDMMSSGMEIRGEGTFVFTVLPVKKSWIKRLMGRW